MFLDTSVRPEGEKQQVGKLKLSKLIRDGSAMFPEGQYLVAGEDLRNPAFCGTCAIGAAMIATGYNGPSVHNHCMAYKWLEPRCEITLAVLEKISCMHFLRQKNRLECANWLEAQGL